MRGNSKWGLDSARLHERKLFSRRSDGCRLETLEERYMDQDSNGIFVARNERGAFVRVVGRGTFQNAQCLRQFGLEAIEEGCPAISLDLSGCKAMDSTFLGVLAGFGLKLRAL